MFTQKSIKIFHSVQEIRPFSLFQNLALGKASTDDKCHFAIVSLSSEFEPRQKLNQSQMSFDNLMGTSYQYQWVCIILSKYFKPRQNPDQSQMSFDYLMGYIMSISMCMQNFITIFHHNIPLSSRDRAIFTFLEFGAWQSLDQGKMSFRNLLG